eukprot:Polyplicarium_translucidae@DN3321_c0_g1_i6.p8
MQQQQAGRGNELIATLLDAEKEADRIVKKARDNRVRKLKEAAHSAEGEMKVFRQKEEDRFYQEYEQKFGAEDNTTTDLEDATRKEIEMVKKDYKANKDGVMTYLSSIVCSVEMSLSEVAKQQIRATTA